MQRYRYTFLTCILIVFLGGPFLLKLKDFRLEIYPAIIFPSGAGKHYSNKSSLQVNSIELFGNPVSSKNSDLKKINKRKFLGEIPLQNFFHLARGNFGLKEYTEEFKLYKPPIKFTIKNTFTPESVLETKTWLRKQLRKQGFNDSYFIMRKYQFKYNTESKNLQSKNLVEEQIYELD